jgi:adenylyltransferase and sulfurtransferase
MKDSYEASESARGPSCSLLDKSPELEPSISVGCADFERLRQSGEPHILLDVRVKEQYDLCSLPGAINIPIASIPQRMDDISSLSDGTKTVYCICRRGIASVMATKLILDSLEKFPSIHSVKNVTGGLDAWRLQVDRSFPTY